MPSPPVCNPDLRILVVDDDKHIRTIATAMLKHAGFDRVQATEDPVNALRKMEKGLVQLVLLDWKLPQLQGIEILRTIRSYDRDLPIIMFTAHKGREKVLEAIEAGVSDYISKPFTQMALVTKINEVMAKYKEDRRQEAIKNNQF